MYLGSSTDGGRRRVWRPAGVGGQRPESRGGGRSQGMARRVDGRGAAENLACTSAPRRTGAAEGLEAGRRQGTAGLHAGESTDGGSGHAVYSTRQLLQGESVATAGSPCRSRGGGGDGGGDSATLTDG